LVHLC